MRRRQALARGMQSSVDLAFDAGLRDKELDLLRARPFLGVSYMLSALVAL